MGQLRPLQECPFEAGGAHQHGRDDDSIPPSIPNRIHQQEGWKAEAAFKMLAIPGETTKRAGVVLACLLRVRRQPIATDAPSSSPCEQKNSDS